MKNLLIERFQQLAGIKPLYEQTSTVFTDEDLDDLRDIILKYVEDPDDAEAEVQRFDDDGFDAMSDMVTTNLLQDPEYKAWYNKLHSIEEDEIEISLEDLDFETLIEKHSPETNDFWYLDPPYIVADTRKYYTHNFSYEDHVRLKENIDKIHKSGAKFMISYDDKEDVYNLYSDYKIHAIPVQYNTNRGEGTKDKLYNELVIVNYDITEQQSLF